MADDDRVVWVFRPNMWRAKLPSIVALVFIINVLPIAMVVGQVPWPTTILVSIGCVILGLLVLLSWHLEALGACLQIGTKRTTLRIGILAKNTAEMRHKDIRSVDCRQHFFHRLLGIGYVGLSSAAGSGVEISLWGLENPQGIASLLRRCQDHADGSGAAPWTAPAASAAPDRTPQEREEATLQALAAAAGTQSAKIWAASVEASRLAGRTLQGAPKLVDMLLGKMAGDGNTILFIYLRVLAGLAAAVLVVAILIWIF